jgi:hypothetical protein
VRPLGGRRLLALAVTAAIVGIGIAMLDSRPGWDDTAIIVASLILAGAAFAFLGRRLPWLWALLIGAWVPLLEMSGSAGGASLAALAFAAIGAGVGWGLARLVLPDRRASA